MPKSFDNNLAEELAESFINGNRSWVREQLKKRRKGKVRLVMAIYARLQEYGHGEADSFQRIVVDEL